MRIITKIRVEFQDDITKDVSSVECSDGKIKSTVNGQEKILDDRRSQLIVEQLNAMMGVAFSKMTPS